MLPPANSHSRSDRPFLPLAPLYRAPHDRHLLSNPYLLPCPGISPQHILPTAPQGMDPSSVDFRAFYPYTPNEVKHRKRTTSAQLKILEAIFKRDTKPNATLRNELALQLAMTARGVQVWFQNRRAKEKIKAGKVSSTGQPAQLNQGFALNDDGTPSPRSPEDTADLPDSPTEAPQSPSPDEGFDYEEPTSQQSSPAVSSPPQLHLITDSQNASWPNSPVEPAELASFTRKSSHLLDANLAAYRRGSLPVNMYPHLGQPTDSPPSTDSLNPLARRRSVDASLHRLASNPYAHLARAKNGVIFGNRFTGLPHGRHHFTRVPYASQPQGQSVYADSGIPHHLDARRSSTDSRTFRFSPKGSASPPSPLSPYNTVRASLPGHLLYTIPSRNVSSPVPGPLPSPGFSFGAASSPPTMSPNLADSERNSPDSLGSFPYRTEDQDTEDDGTSASYDAFSRFGSIASVATSDSSINSEYYSDVGRSLADHDLGLGPDLSRRDSCTSGHFLGLMSGLAVNGLPNHTGNSYTIHGDIQNNVGNESNDANNTNNHSNVYSSPSSTVSPKGSPHVQGTASTGVPISRSSELAFALQSQSDQENTREDNITHSSHTVPTVAEALTGTSHQDSTLYYYVSDSNTLQSPNQSSDPQIGSPLEYAEKYQYDTVCLPVSGNEDYSTYTSLSSGYTVDGHDHSLHNQVDYGGCTPIADVYTAYGETMEPHVIQNTESFANYSQC